MTHILIIDDDANIREDLTDFFQLVGFEAAAAANGNEGLALAISSPPDLILCDINLPDIDGYTVLANVQATEKLRTIPFVFIGGTPDLLRIESEFNLDAKYVLPKPFKLQDLLSRVQTLLNLPDAK